MDVFSGIGSWVEVGSVEDVVIGVDVVLVFIEWYYYKVFNWMVLVVLMCKFVWFFDVRVVINFE